LFTTSNEVDGNDRIGVLSDAYWRRRFGADPTVVGRTLTLDNGEWLIAGVMPPEFTFPVDERVDLWVPYVVPASEKARATDHDNYLTVAGRLKTGVTEAVARRRMTEISNALVAAYPAWYAGDRNRAIVMPMRDTVVGADVRSWMLMLLGAVTCVLLIACVNVANLLLARATTRGQELGVRAALGATRWQLGRGVLVESLVLSLAGTALGVVAAWWGVSVLHAAMPPRVPRASDIGIDLRVLTVAALASIVTGVGFGLGPAIAGARRDVSSLLRDGGRSTTASAPRERLRMSLVVAEVSLAVVLLVGAGLFIASFARVVAAPVGLDYAGVTAVSVVPDTSAVAPDARVRFANQSMHDMLDRVRPLRGIVASCVFSGGLPFSGGYHRTSFTRTDGRMFNGPDDGPDVYFVTPDYFDVLRLPRLAGRVFNAADDRAGAQPTLILNALAASRYFDAEAPIGRVGRVGTGGLSSTDLTIVGVVGNMRPLGPDTPPRPEVYVPIALSNVTYGYVMARTSGDMAAINASIAGAISAVSPSMTVASPQTLASLFARRIAQRRFNMVLLVLFGALALAITSTGIYGVIAYVVSQRTKEIGVRMALGAAPAGVVGMVLGRVLTLVAVGLGAGLAMAWLLAGSVRAFLFEIGPHDPLVYSAVPIALVFAGLTAAIGPARRAARVDLVATLRRH
jgi:predicted permease